MIFLYLLPFYLAIGGYLLFRVFHWTFFFCKAAQRQRFKIPFGIVYSICLVSPLFATLLPKCLFTIWIRRLSTYWLGVMLYMLMAVALIDIIRFLLKHTRLKKSFLFTSKTLVTMGIVTAVFLSCICTYGLYNARNIKLKTYDIDVDKSCGDNKGFKNRTYC